MKIVFLGDALAEHLRRWSKFFAGLGHEVHVITWNREVLGGFEPAILHRLEKRRVDSGIIGRAVNLIDLRVKVRRAIAQIQPDLVHAHAANAYGWLTMLTGFHPYLVSPWGNDVLIDIHRSAIDRFLTPRALKNADMVHCDGENIKEVLVRFGVDPRKIVIIAFGVDVRHFAPGPVPKNFLDKYRLVGSKVIVSTRTLNPVHNVESVIRAVPLVLRRCPNARVLVVASGSEDKMLRELAQTLGVGPSVVFTGRVEEEEMVNCLRAGDVYVSTSLSESGVASSTAEAMSCSLPVINTDTGDIRAWIRDGEGGFVVPVRSPEIIAEKLTYFLENDDARLRAGRINRKVIEERYNVYVEMSKMQDVYRNVVAQYGAS
jgi:glycosyltransferase involved in cell wall biosynthesis